MSAPVLAAAPSAIARAGDILREGGLVAIPTETVYGLAADAGDPAAVARLFAAKERPRFNPLIAHVADTETARAVARLSPTAERLAAAFWPGPLTLVAPVRAGAPVCDLARAGLDTVAVRAPAHPVAQAVIAAAGRPIAAPSANPSGRLSATRAGDVARALAHAVDLIIDGGPCALGLESTVVDTTADPPVILRAGALPRSAVAEAAGALGTVAADGRRRSPGTLARHYAPRRARLRLDARAPEPG
ncbi:MAG: threonylcarbamoyl-AMP synthase, partial [Caulobacterales bacterium]|nr:threonylcarbamoyl-AMP synthase [Caulobacterales bacterium]